MAYAGRAKSRIGGSPRLERVRVPSFILGWIQPGCSDCRLRLICGEEALTRATPSLDGCGWTAPTSEAHVLWRARSLDPVASRQKPRDETFPRCLRHESVHDDARASWVSSRPSVVEPQQRGGNCLGMRACSDG